MEALSSPLSLIREPEAFPLRKYLQERLNDDFIEEVTHFLLGSCSCEVKAQNPGWDLLLSVDWDDALQKAGAASAPAGSLKAQTLVIQPREEFP